MPTQKLTHESFWAHMEKNSEIVARMPAWMKGSPVNYRPDAATSAPAKKPVVNALGPTNKSLGQR